MTTTVKEYTVRDAVLTARRRRDRAQEELLEAIEAFLEEGHTYTELGAVLGVSRQAARQMVERGRRS